MKNDYRTIPALIAQGLTREQIAERFGITLGSLQVMCSRKRIRLPLPQKPAGTGYHQEKSKIFDMTD